MGQKTFNELIVIKFEIVLHVVPIIDRDTTVTLLHVMEPKGRQVEHFARSHPDRDRPRVGEFRKLLRWGRMNETWVDGLNSCLMLLSYLFAR